MTNSKKTNRIEVRVSNDEYTIISENASKQGITMSSHLLRAALNPHDIANIKYSKELNDLLIYINELTYTLGTKYLPEDTVIIMNYIRKWVNYGYL